MTLILIFSAMSFFYIEGFLIARVFDIFLCVYILFFISSRKVTIQRQIFYILLFILFLSNILLLSELIRGYPKYSFLPLMQIIVAIFAGRFCITIKDSQSVIAIWVVSTGFVVILYLSQVIRAYWLGADNPLELLYFMRLVPGLNNLGNSMLAFITISAYCATCYYKRTLSLRYLYVTFALIFILLTYPSRQVMLGNLILLTVLLLHLYRVKTILILFSLSTCVIMYVALDLGIIEFITARFEKNIQQGSSYSRVRQYELAWDLFSSFPAFGSMVDPYPILEQKRLYVFESSWSDLVVRNGLVGLIGVVIMLSLFITQINFSSTLFISPLVAITFFNETLFQEELWFVIALLCNIYNNYLSTGVLRKEIKGI